MNPVSFFFFFSSRRRHTRFDCDWSSDVCSSDLHVVHEEVGEVLGRDDDHGIGPRRLQPCAHVAEGGMEGIPGGRIGQVCAARDAGRVAANACKYQTHLKLLRSFRWWLSSSRRRPRAPVRAFARRRAWPAGSRPRACPAAARSASAADRKSTRLNSSHSQISYAVFCLKKKKNKDTTNTCIRNFGDYCRRRRGRRRVPPTAARSP